ncbi:CLUMA_CG003844, isoform A [Clunio marinus]|uniref:CLUMA_CG003844, isoform A n=1 Tax=Clunio marinus TaxID=568069 RepID=A0A1J1HUF0_9DIPT|nr:CLUMA_CG003844, isoform A [Clunio marinus]
MTRSIDRFEAIIKNQIKRHSPTLTTSLSHTMSNLITSINEENSVVNAKHEWRSNDADSSFHDSHETSS